MKKNDERMNTGADIARSIGLVLLKTEVHVHLLIGNADLFSGLASETLGVELSK